MTSTSTRVHLPEIVVDGHRLGRHINHDPRSLRYLIRPDGTAVSKTWARDTPVLDQGDLGSCTGNAMCGLLGTDPFHSTVPGSVSLNEAEAVKLYSEATALDTYSGSYPPDDTGSDGLSVAKAAQRDGLISGYQHITSVAAAQTAIQHGPFIIGSNWYESMDDPNPGGLVTIGGKVRGGHEYECHGYDAGSDTWELVNSWGTSWGVAGYFQYTGATFARLLSESGDATVPVPLTAPAPTPTPTPIDAIDAALVKAGDAWEPSILSKLTKAGKFKTAYDAWKKAKGYA